MAAILKPYTFVAGTKAKANEVNANFDTVYSGVNSLDTTVTENTADIADLNTNKANINGSTANRFAVANPVNSNDAVNKQYLFNSIANSLPYINGLGLSRAGDNKIHIDTGSAYDSTYTTLIALEQSLEKENTEQSASTTYYVYLIAHSDGSSSDVMISTSSDSPALPTGYDIYRRIGYYKTDSNNIIAYTTNDSSNGKPEISDTYQSGSSGYIVYSNGLCMQWGVCGSSATVTFLKTFKDTNYYINANQPLIGGGFEPTTGIYSRSATSFSVYSASEGGAAGSWNVTWMAFGYLEAGQY